MFAKPVSLSSICCIRAYSSSSTDKQLWPTLINDEVQRVSVAAKKSRGVKYWAVAVLIDHKDAQNMLDVYLAFKYA